MNTWQVENSGTISDEIFNLFREMIFQEAGISLSSAKKTLVCSRLAKRLRILKLRSYADYIDYLNTRDPDGSEREQMVNCLTTNKTDFFREPHHFDFLREQVIPEIAQRAALGEPKRLRIWSAACSTGKEPYSAAISILESLPSRYGWQVEIVATDVNTEVLKQARSGIYPIDDLIGMDREMIRKYFLRGTGNWDGQCQVADNVRSMVKFSQLNFMDPTWHIQGDFDVIFCRNVLIYFNSQTQQQLLPRLIQRIHEGGYLMLGHSENLPWLNDRLIPLGKTIHQLPRSSNELKTAKSRSVVANQSKNQRNTSSPSAESPVGSMPKHELISGEVFATAEPIIIATTLGSCVAACLYDPVAKVGGMNHFMLPSSIHDPRVSARFGIHAMELLINKVVGLGGHPSRLRAKVFGGAKVITAGESRDSVGKANSDFVRKYLQSKGIPIEAQQLDSDAPLRLLFKATEGVVYAKQLQKIGAEVK